jgi:ATP-dependent DNA helicase RecQ
LEFDDPAQPALLEMLMRRYTGLFSYPVPIDEDYVASRLGMTVPSLRQSLYRLSLMHVIKYIPNDHATVLYLHHDRLRPKNLNLDPAKYDMLKSSYEEKMNKMIDYVQETDVCRSSYLLEYFGQNESKACLTCDICRETGSREKVLADLRKTADDAMTD